MLRYNDVNSEIMQSLCNQVESKLDGFIIGIEQTILQS